jgi:hypothetical protein
LIGCRQEEEEENVADTLWEPFKDAVALAQENLRNKSQFIDNEEAEGLNNSGTKSFSSRTPKRYFKEGPPGGQGLIFGAATDDATVTLQELHQTRLNESRTHTVTAPGIDGTTDDDVRSNPLDEFIALSGEPVEPSRGLGWETALSEKDTDPVPMSEWSVATLVDEHWWMGCQLGLEVPIRGPSVAIQNNKYCSRCGEKGHCWQSCKGWVPFEHRNHPKDNDKDKDEASTKMPREGEKSRKEKHNLTKKRKRLEKEDSRRLSAPGRLEVGKARKRRKEKSASKTRSGTLSVSPASTKKAKGSRKSKSSGREMLEDGSGMGEHHRKRRRKK